MRIVMCVHLDIYLYVTENRLFKHVRLKVYTRNIYEVHFFSFEI